MDSDAVDQLDAPAEVFYRRLMSKVDDYGLFDARPAILCSHLYPLRRNSVREADISRWMAACQKAGLIALYEAKGKPFGQMLNTQWAARSEPKHPLPPWVKEQMPTGDVDCKQLQTTVPLVVGVVGDVVEVGDEGGKGRKRPRSPETALSDDFAISDRVRAWAAEKGHQHLDEHLESFVRKCKAKDYRYRDWDAAFMNAISEDWGKVREQAGRAKALETGVGLPWYSTDETVIAKGRSLSMDPRPGESMAQFKGRVSARISAGAH